LRRVRVDRRNAEVVRHRYHERLATGRILERLQLDQQSTMRGPKSPEAAPKK